MRSIEVRRLRIPPGIEVPGLLGLTRSCKESGIKLGRTAMLGQPMTGAATKLEIALTFLHESQQRKDMATSERGIKVDAYH